MAQIKHHCHGIWPSHHTRPVIPKDIQNDMHQGQVRPCFTFTFSFRGVFLIKKLRTSEKILSSVINRVRRKQARLISNNRNHSGMLLKPRAFPSQCHTYQMRVHTTVIDLAIDHSQSVARRRTWAQHKEIRTNRVTPDKFLEADGMIRSHPAPLKRSLQSKGIPRREASGLSAKGLKQRVR